MRTTDASAPREDASATDAGALVDARSQRDSGTSLTISPMLAPDPDVLAILEALGDNSSAILPPLNTHGDWNDVARSHNMHTFGPQGRDYTNKAVWMPDRLRAFFCGANHGAPHRLNDAWEYDLPSNTWVMLFAPDPNNAAGVMEIREGIIRGPDGEALETVKYVQTERGGPTHYGHTWWGLAYDPNMRAALWMNVGIGSSPVAYMEAELGEEDPTIYRGPPLWAFYPAEARWERVLSRRPWPSTPYAGAMEFVPELGGAFWYSAEWNGQGMDVYEPAENAWRPLRPNDGDSLYHSVEAPRPESIMCYDRMHRVVVAQSPNRSTYHYDVASNTWTRVLAPDENSDEVPRGHDASSQMYFDPINGVCLLYESARPDGIWSYASATRTWTRHVPEGPEVPDTRKVISYFDEAWNVFVVNVGAQTWVYRLRNAR
jgi:hypothetical protein